VSDSGAIFVLFYMISIVKN